MILLNCRIPISVCIFGTLVFGIDVNAQEFKCADGANLIVQPGDKNRPFDAIDVEPIKNLHNKVAGQSPPWLASITGPADANVFYEMSGKPRVLVMSWCAPRECDTRYAYAAVIDQSYGIDVVDNGKPSILGALSVDARAAIACKRAFNDARKFKR
jgi:hypothetical protein